MKIGHLQAGPRVIVGADVVSLYPSLDAEESSEAVREEVENSKVEFDNVNWEEATTYIAINNNRYEARKMKVDDLIPVRRYKKGPKPTIRGEDSKSNKNLSEVKWVHNKKTYTNADKSKILGAVMKTGTKASFQNHVYRYCNQVFKQIHGGPTGFDVTGKVAKIRMKKVLKKLKRILKRSGIRWDTTFIYVDDWRMVMQALKKGVMYCHKCQVFKFSLTQFREDVRLNENDDVRTAKLILEVLNSLEHDLKFTTEVVSDFPSMTLPTLDFQMWPQEGTNNTTGKTYTSIKYKFYEKEMGSKLVMLETSAASWQSKVSSLTNEVTRRLLTTSEDLPDKEKMEILETYCTKLKRSGYNNRQVQDIIISGVVGYSRRRELIGKPHREAWETAEAREMKKLTSQTTWFLNRKRTHKTTTKTTSNTMRPKRQGIQRDERQPAAVLFVKRTPNGSLATELKQAEFNLSKTFIKKVKIVERNGTQLQALLTRADPWGEDSCVREDCMVCTHNMDKTPNCRTKNLTYRSTCRLCKAAGAKCSYLGETSRSLRERWGEHVKDSQDSLEESHIAQHLMNQHLVEWKEKALEGDAWKYFSIEIVKTHRSAFKRQIHEAVLIMLEEGVILNSKSEYNRCLVPTLEVQGQARTKTEITQLKQRQRQQDDKRIDETDTQVEIYRQTKNKRNTDDEPSLEIDNNREPGSQNAKKLRYTHADEHTHKQSENYRQTEVKEKPNPTPEVNQSETRRKRKATTEDQPQHSQSREKTKHDQLKHTHKVKRAVNAENSHTNTHTDKPAKSNSSLSNPNRVKVKGKPSNMHDIRKYLNSKHRESGAKGGNGGKGSESTKNKSGANNTNLNLHQDQGPVDTGGGHIGPDRPQPSG